MASIDNTMGSALLGYIFKAGLYGVFCVQTWYYFNRYGSTDHWFNKALVGLVFVCDSIHQRVRLESLAFLHLLITGLKVYWHVITNYSRPEGLSNLVWSILLEVLFNVGHSLLDHESLVTEQQKQSPHRRHSIAGIG
ncbi:hypothetical protein K438DRAFT_2026306 [Mycena galopus ATCC 62051]|nr:hypothetical protein K438DRAFT_2026306 [Mycena galopus ATCC 62051]